MYKKQIIHRNMYQVYLPLSTAWKDARSSTFSPKDEQVKCRLCRKTRGEGATMRGVHADAAARLSSSSSSASSLSVWKRPTVRSVVETRGG